MGTHNWVATKPRHISSRVTCELIYESNQANFIQASFFYFLETNAYKYATMCAVDFKFKRLGEGGGLIYNLNT